MNYTDYENIPQPIKDIGLFCCWKYENRNHSKTKVPYMPGSSVKARPNDPSTFTTFDIALKGRDGFDGLGVGIFSGICGIDLDHCIDDSGKVSPLASEIVQTMQSYTEISPSGTGLHILFQAEAVNYDRTRYLIMNHSSGIEVYVYGTTNKYLTLTGKVYAFGNSFGDRSKELQKVLDTYMQHKKITKNEPAVNSNLSDSDILHRGRTAENGEKFASFFDGSWQQHYRSQSEADMALCSILAFWTGKNPVQMDRLFRQSSLMREKWDRKQSGSTYGKITIDQAIHTCTNAYKPPVAEKPNCATLPEKPSSRFNSLVSLEFKQNELLRFPVEALPNPIYEYVMAVADHSQTAPDMAATIALGVLSTCLQKKFKVECGQGYHEPVNLYIAVIAQPGERKSSVMRSMTKCISDYEEEYNLAHEHEIQSDKYQRDNLISRIASLQKKLEHKYTEEVARELNQLKSELANRPQKRPLRLFADDVTSEALVTLMAQNGGALSVVSSEGGPFDIMGGRYSGKANFDVFLKSSCGDSIRVDRLGRELDYIPDPALTCILSVQPRVLDDIMANNAMSGRGLLARFLYCSPPSLIGHRVYNAPAIPLDVASDYKQLMFRLLNLPMPEKPYLLQISREAREIISAHFAEHEKYLTQEGLSCPDWANKYIGTVHRIAGLIHVAEMSDNNPDYEISGTTMHRAIEIGRYFLSHANYAYSLMAVDTDLRKAKFVCAKLKSHVGKSGERKINRGKLYQSCRGKYYAKTEELFPTLELLEDRGYIYIESQEYKGVGRPKDFVIHINPQLDCSA